MTKDGSKPISCVGKRLALDLLKTALNRLDLPEHLIENRGYATLAFGLYGAMVLRPSHLKWARSVLPPFAFESPTLGSSRLASRCIKPT